MMFMQGSEMQKVKEIADIYVGTTFRSKVVPTSRGNTRVIQVKDLGGNNSNRIDAKDALHIEGVDDLRERQELKIGDILFRSRGLTTTARLLSKKAGATIVASPIFIIRVKSELAIPRYLLWWINQPSSQTYFRSHSDGSLVRMVSKKTLADLEVALPPIANQEKIADFYDLAMKEQRLLTEIRINRKHYAHRVMRQMVADTTNHGQLNINE